MSEEKPEQESQEAVIVDKDPSLFVTLARKGEGCAFIIREEWRPVAGALCRKYKTLEWAGRLLNRIVFLENGIATPHEKAVSRYTNVGKVPAKMSEIIYQATGYLWEYTVEIYRKNCPELTPAKLVALLYHALHHIGPEGKIMGHDVEEWTEMEDHFGPGWVFADVPDLLGEGITWVNAFTRPMLIPDSSPKVPASEKGVQ